MNYFRTALRFIRDHKMFVGFFTAALVLNTWLVLHQATGNTEFITSSTHDRGPLGTYAFYAHLERFGTSVKRIKLPLYRELDATRQAGRTLLMLNPRFPPNAWEWEKIMDWVRAGNRLITTGTTGPNPSFFQPREFTLRTTRKSPSELQVLLPLDATGTTGQTLNPHPHLGLLHFFGSMYQDADSVNLRHFLRLPPDMFPFVAMGKHTIAAKRRVGDGEWVLFTPFNVFSNTMLRDTTWYAFATKLLTGSARYGKTLLFDEYHNGYRATQSLWQLLEYYGFTSGIIYLSVLGLVFLFWQGVRIMSPRPLQPGFSRDVIPGIRSMSAVLYRYRAWNGLIRRELNHIRTTLFGRAAPENQPNANDIIHQFRARGGSVPEHIGTEQEIQQSIARVYAGDNLDKRSALSVLNAIACIRKDLKL